MLQAEGSSSTHDQANRQQGGANDLGDGQFAFRE